MNLLLYFRARVRLLQGRAEEALADARDVGGRYARLGLRRAVPPWRSQAAILSGDAGAGRGGARAGRALGHAARARAGAARARPRHRRRRPRCTKPWPSSRPRRTGSSWPGPAVDLGAALRRAGRRADARAPLRAGMDAAHACGAQPARRARPHRAARHRRPAAQARAPGHRRADPEREAHRDAAANGLTNRQIAQELFVTTATVETHLRHAFRKLDVRARGELGARALRRPA